MSSAAQALVAVPPHAGEAVRMTGLTALCFPSEVFFWTLIHTAAICGSSGTFVYTKAYELLFEYKELLVYLNMWNYCTHKAKNIFI